MKKILIILCYLFLINTISFAEVHIPSGDVNGVWTFDNSPYYIDGEITIPDDSTLTIEPGVHVIFSGHYKFHVQGQLLAIGAENDSIYFTIDDTTGFSNMNIPDGGWHGIRFDQTPTTNDSSKIIHCKLEYGKTMEGWGENYWGGAIFIKYFSKLIISNCTISNNIASLGGGIYCNGSPKIENTIIINNYASGGGGIYYNTYTSPTITNSIISYNIVECEGGGIYYNGYGLYTILNIKNCKITNNYANEFSGGIEGTRGSLLQVINSLICNNHGSGISGEEPRLEITNSTITNNSYDGIHIWGIYLPPKNQTMNIEICNKFVEKSKEPRDFISTITNTIIGSNEESQVTIWGAEESEVSFYYCDILGGYEGFDWETVNYIGDYENNIDIDPRFIAPTNGTGIEFDGLNADWSLQSSSFCINNGIPDTTGLNLPESDLAGNPRIYNGSLYRIDIAAYEYQGEPDPIPKIIVAPLELSFGLCTIDSTSVEKLFSILNIGHIELQIDSITAPIGFEIKREDDPEFGPIIESFTIEAHRDTLISVVFKPTLSQNYSGNIVINSNDPEEDTVLVSVSGIGTTSAVVSGIIATDTVWEADTVKVVGSVTINDSVTLIINPGSVVEFQGHYQINVQGRILAMGTENDSIVFTVKNYLHYWDGWGGIRFNETPTTNDSSKFEFCKLQYCYRFDGYSTKGGALFLKNFSKLIISNCKVTNNYVDAWSMYGAHSKGAGIYCENSSSIIINSEICNNTALGNGYDSWGYGGGMYCLNSSPKIISLKIFNNEAMYGSGDGIYCKNNSNPQFQNTLIMYNYGEGITCNSSSPTVINSTITNNEGGIGCGNSSSPNIINTILWENEYQVYLGSVNDDPNFYYCDIQGGLEEFSGSGAGLNYNGTYENNIEADPLFVDQTNGDFHLIEGSPCIDAGTPDTTGLNLPPWDLDGNIRIWDGNGDSLAIIDMGCYEYGAPSYGVDDTPESNVEFKLYQNYPNPFNPDKTETTTIYFNINRRDIKNAEIIVYNIKGQLVKKFKIQNLKSKISKVVWDGKDENGNLVSSGIYLYTLIVGDEIINVKKCIIII